MSASRSTARGSEAEPFKPAAGGLTVAVKVTPKASRTRVIGLARDAEGAALLAVAVSAPPEDGKANAALIKLLAKQWRLPKAALTVTAGAASRHKTLHIAGDPERLRLDLEAWLADIR